MQLETNLSVACLKMLNAFSVIASFFFVFLFVLFFSLLGEICSREFYQFYLVEKNPRIILVCRSDALLMD